MAASGSTRKRGRYLLDTNIVTALFKQNAAVHAELAAAEQVLLPSTVLGELYYGAARSGRPQQNLEQLEEFAATSIWSRFRPGASYSPDAQRATGRRATTAPRHQASSTFSFLPRADAARSRVDSVTDGLVGSSKRSSAGRLVLIKLAISDLVSLRRFISLAIWKAIIRLVAVASAASRRFSSRRKSSNSLPRCSLFIKSLLA